MRILVTGGTGVVGTSTVSELVSRGHEVVLLSRHAERDVRQWPHGVIARQGDISDASSIRGAAGGCDGVLHMAAIVEESAPDLTFASINVQGTRHALDEAARARVARFVYVSSLGAPKGESNYHRSKRDAEALVRESGLEWTICRPGNVYGPGDEQISMLLRLVRSPSPVVPLIGDGKQPIQPIWHADLARALALIVERSDLAARELELAGSEITSQQDLVDRLAAVTGNSVRAVPVPELVASLGARVVSLVGWDVSLSDDQVQMVSEGNHIQRGNPNALTEVLGITPTPLDEGLRCLATSQPEQNPREGIGALKRKLFWADITGAATSAERLFAHFRTNFNALTPVFVDATAESSAPVLEDGATITLALPLRGNVQVRALGLDDRQVTLITLAGHPLAGAVRFLTEAHGPSVRFRIEVFDRAANLIDLLAMRAVGDHLQERTWRHVVESVVAASGGRAADGVHVERETLSEEHAEKVEAWLDELILQRARDTAPA